MSVAPVKRLKMVMARVWQLAPESRGELREAEVVAGGIAERRGDAVRILARLLGELDAARLQFRDRSVDVVGREEDRTCRALGHQLPHLLRGLRVEDRRP